MLALRPKLNENEKILVSINPYECHFGCMYLYECMCVVCAVLFIRVSLVVRANGNSTDKHKCGSHARLKAIDNCVYNTQRECVAVAAAAAAAAVIALNKFNTKTLELSQNAAQYTQQY